MAPVAVPVVPAVPVVAVVDKGGSLLVLDTEKKEVISQTQLPQEEVGERCARRKDNELPIDWELASSYSLASHYETNVDMVRSLMAFEPVVNTYEGSPDWSH